MMNQSFPETLSNYQKEVEKELKNFFGRKIDRAAGPSEKEVLKILEEFSFRPAKRMRPILVNCGYFLAGGKNKKTIVETSIFIEFIHNFLLIHDDIIDQDQFRRGGKTIHHIYGGGHYGQSMAIVLGDVACSLGYEILSSSRFPIKYRILAIEKLNWMLFKTGYGQMLEMELRRKTDSTKKIEAEQVLEIYKSKTALYSFVGPLQIGALLAGASEIFLKKIEEFALPLGIAFQIQDDFRDKDYIWPNSESESYQELVEKLINQAKEVLIYEKSFSRQGKQFLLSLADYMMGGKY